VRTLWKLGQQCGLKMVLVYVTNVLVKMSIFRTRCMLFYFAKAIGFVSWGNSFPFYLRLFWRTYQQPNPEVGATGQHLIFYNFLSQQNARLFLLLFELVVILVAGRDQSAADQPNKLAEARSPPIVTIISDSKSVPRECMISSCNTTTHFFLMCLSLKYKLLAGEDQSQADQPNSLAEGPPM